MVEIIETKIPAITDTIKKEADVWEDWFQKMCKDTERTNESDLFANAFDFYLRYKELNSDIRHWALYVELDPSPGQEVIYNAISQNLHQLALSNQTVSTYLKEPVDPSRFLLILSSNQYMFVFIKYHQPMKFILQNQSKCIHALKFLGLFPHTKNSCNQILRDDVENNIVSTSEEYEKVKKMKMDALGNVFTSSPI